MAAGAVARILTTALVGAGVLLLSASLWLLSESARDADEFNRLHQFILLINAVGVIVLLVLIVANMIRLTGEYRRHVPGARLKTRMLIMFVVLAVLPVAVVYYFSLQFLNRGIDSYFDAEVDQGLEDALDLSRSVLDRLMREFLADTEAIASQLASSSDRELVSLLGQLRRGSGASEFTLLGRNQRIIATSSDRPPTLMPLLPGNEVQLQVTAGHSYVGLDSMPTGGFIIRTAVLLPLRSPTDEGRMLQGLYPVTGRFSLLAESVQQAYSRYGELEYLRTPLRYTLALTLTLVLLLSLLAAVWGAFLWARRLVSPLQSLVAGTRAVAEGDFDTRLPTPARDEIGFLVTSFNDMTRRLANAREVARRSQQAVENERGKLAAILSSLSTGVVALEPDRRIRTANDTASAILDADLVAATGKPLAAAGAASQLALQFAAAVEERLGAGERDWRAEIVLRSEAGRRVLKCACAVLPGENGEAGGHVLVFDDITEVLQAQREAAWGEVARRLAHEIKNPLTPIQLSAERIRRRFLDKMNDTDAALLERGTSTIVQQVEAMKAMVNAFSEYARAPDLEMTRVDLNRLITEVTELYRTHEQRVALELALDDGLGEIQADGGRLRQILHNLIRNAIEALHERPEPRLQIRTRALWEHGAMLAEIVVEDNGPGFQIDLAQVFDPYVTTKTKGTGLGLAIVKKLVEEHAGRIHAENFAAGARVCVVLPRDDEARAMLGQFRMPGQFTGGGVA